MKKIYIVFLSHPLHLAAEWVDLLTEGNFLEIA